MKRIKYQAAIARSALMVFREEIILWYRKQGRDLPWRATQDPYHIVVSEILLHQTTVRSVIPVYAAFLERFPTVQDCAEGPLEDIKAITDPLGYKIRGEWLYRIARYVMEHCQGRFPDTLDALMALPGVGRYTAGAVLSFAFGQDAPILDTNVNRLLGRYFGVNYKDKSAEVQHRLWSLAEAVIPPGAGSEFNQALMDMGAMVCTARKPSCLLCPIAHNCATGLETEKNEWGTSAAEERVTYRNRE
ncbi:MAG: HhH-GPD family protein [Sulfobacillus sp.]